SLLQSGVHDEAFYEELWETILDGNVWEGEITNERKNGEQYVVKQTISPITDKTGEIVRFVAINEDITQLREQQAQLQRERDRLTSLLDAVPTPLVLTTFEEGDPVVERVNRAFEETFGVSEQHLTGTSLDDHIVTHAETDQAKAINDALQAGDRIRCEVSRETADGDTRTFLLQATPFGNEEDEALGAYIDITNRKRAEEKQRLLTEVSQGIGEADTFLDGLERTLEAICAYTEWAYGEVWRPSADGQQLAFACGHATDPAFEQFVEASQSVTFKPGEGLPGRVYASATPEWISDVTDEPVEVFHRTELAADAGLRAAFGIPLVADDDVTAVLTFFLQHHRDRDDDLVEDVSDVVASLGGLVARKQYEQQLKEQRDNLETLNQVVRHDIRNDLQLVQAHAEMAEDHVDEEGREHLVTVQESAASAVELTRTARELAEMLLQSEVETQAVMLAPTLEQQIDEIQSAHPEAVVTVDGSLPRARVRGNEMLGSVFRNLLQNAILHNDKEIPRVTITTSEHEEQVEVRIADNGP
ncbi:MAG: PAS domain-containing protein, partial [Halobacteriaceae archaeon]